MRFRIVLESYVIPIGVLFTVAFGWQYGVTWLGIPKFLLPTPSDIYLAFTELGGLLVEHTLVTLQEILIGFLIGTSVGMAMGILISYSKLCGRVIYPMAIFVKTIPIIAIAPLLTLWFGFDIWSKIAAVIIITFFPLVVSTATGMRSVDPDLIDLLNSLSAKERQVFLKVRLPWSFTHVFSGLKVAITLAVIGAVVGEFVGTRKGLGYVIDVAMSYVDAPQLFVALLILAAMGISLFGLVALIQRLVAPWTHAERART